ncbi:hypothetical protein ACHWQZ_G012396 [Mnemiopsis leidyi]
MSDLSFNKLNVTESLADLSEHIKQMSLLVTDVDKLNKRVGTVTDNEELWVKLSDVHHTFQRKVSICQRLVSSISYVRGLSKYEAIQTSRLKQELNDVVLHYTKLQKQISSRERGVIKRSHVLFQISSQKRGVIKRSHVLFQISSRKRGVIKRSHVLFQISSRKRGVIKRSYVLFQISSRERGVIKRSRHSSGRSMSEEEPQTLLEECWLDGQEILEREQHIKKIEDDMVAVADMMKQISYMVHDQGTELDNIEAHIADSHRTVDEGTSLLGKAEQYSKTRRKRLCCLSVTFIIILATIIITFVIIEKTK